MVSLSRPEGFGNYTRGFHYQRHKNPKHERMASGHLDVVNLALAERPNLALGGEAPATSGPRPRVRRRAVGSAAARLTAACDNRRSQ